MKKILLSAINKYITPGEVKELLYQSVPYVGFGRAPNFFGVVIKVFDKKGIEMPLENRSNTNAEDRYQKGREIQDRYFGVEMIQAMNNIETSASEISNIITVDILTAVDPA